MAGASAYVKLLYNYAVSTDYHCVGGRGKAKQKAALADTMAMTRSDQEVHRRLEAISFAVHDAAAPEVLASAAY
jgi:hypothetical protein